MKEYVSQESDEAPPDSFKAIPTCWSSLRPAMISPTDQLNDVARPTDTTSANLYHKR